MLAAKKILLHLVIPMRKNARNIFPVIMVLFALGGCAGYKVGNQGLFNHNIQTVYVPIFESESFRRNLGERLTEAVVKRIEERTPYKVIGRPSADSIISGTILADSQSVTAINDYGDTRQKKFTMVVQVEWTDRRTGNLIRRFNVSCDSTLVAEVGQSMTTTQQETIEKLAEDIVACMEIPW